MLSVNCLIQFIGVDGTTVTERILWIEPESIIAFTIEIYTEDALPRVCVVSEIHKSLENGDAKITTDDPWLRFVDETKLSAKSIHLRDRAWEIIESIVTEANEPAIYKRESRGPLIQQIMDEYKVTKRYIYKYLRKYWQRGKNKNALLPDYEKSGGKGKTRVLSGKKLGRPRKHESQGNEGINVDDAVKRIFRTAAKKYLLNKKENSVNTAYQMMLKEFFAEDYYVENGVKKTILIPEEELPTLGQFRYWYEKEFNIQEMIIARKGVKNYLKDHRSLTGRSDQEVIGPGSKYQIDATVADVYLVSRYNRNWIIGRPVIYAIIDVFSRMVAGLYVGLEGPSWAGAMMALTNTASDKTKFCKEYDITIDHHLWPCSFLPEALLADRGELIGKTIETLSNAFNIRIENTAPYRADWKGIVERHFRTIHARVKPFLPGYVQKDFLQRGGRDYRLDAKLDLYQFTQIIIHCALHHNNKHSLLNYDRDEMMIGDDVFPNALELWNWGITNRTGKLRSFPEELVKLNLMPTTVATVTHRGIRFEKMHYSCQRAVKECWFERARAKGTWKAQISYDPRNMNYIYLREENGREFEKCHLLDSQERYKDKTFDEILYLLEYEKINLKKMKSQEVQDNIDLMSHMEKIVSEAEEMTSRTKEPFQSKAAKIKGIRQHRQEERERQREMEAFELDKDSLEDSIKSAEIVPIKNDRSTIISSPTRSIDLLKRKQKERMHGNEE
ncbi:DDE-type integrase/transposase/recombinase [Heliobacterium chlorum]|uniref:DDE-type integrase/transposase/recombinase n=1 Tax=Heliobacterium chlorum TaxID=2698 RepID=A0ABR7T0H2_HELCL|nr:Mu transposase C-terminal domain-containing protein [Heliobacterium chlorum]MBC9784295.1 DDE-type integrase/transposase/recombinase [Heliobacterium chlorum]